MQTLYSFIKRFIWRCGNASVFTQDSASQDNLWPIRLIFRRLHFLVCSDKVPVERANSVAVGNATCCLSSQGGHSCCYWCRYIMIARDSLVVILLSPDESEENNTCHVSSVVLSIRICGLILLWFVQVDAVIGFSWTKRPQGTNVLCVRYLHSL